MMFGILVRSAIPESGIAYDGGNLPSLEEIIGKHPPTLTYVPYDCRPDFAGALNALLDDNMFHTMPGYVISFSRHSFFPSSGKNHRKAVAKHTKRRIQLWRELGSRQKPRYALSH
jgi:hypothetical protein